MPCAVFAGTTYDECVNWIVSSLCWRYGSVASSKPSDLFGWSVSHIMDCFCNFASNTNRKRMKELNFKCDEILTFTGLLLLITRAANECIASLFRFVQLFLSTFFYRSGWRETNSINGAYEMRYVWYDRCEVHMIWNIGKEKISLHICFH